MKYRVHPYLRYANNFGKITNYVSADTLNYFPFKTFATVNGSTRFCCIFEALCQSKLSLFCLLLYQTHKLPTIQYNLLYQMTEFCANINRGSIFFNNLNPFLNHFYNSGQRSQEFFFDVHVLVNISI